MYSRDEPFLRSLECYFGVYLNTKTTLSWALKPFVIRVHTLHSLCSKSTWNINIWKPYWDLLTCYKNTYVAYHEWSFWMLATFHSVFRCTSPPYSVDTLFYFYTYKSLSLLFDAHICIFIHYYSHTIQTVASVKMLNIRNIHEIW